MIIEEIMAFFQVIGSTAFYLVHYVVYTFVFILDLFYQPFAGFFNSIGNLMGVLVDLFETCLSWAGETFMWFVAAMITIYAFFFLIRLIVMLKEVILRWL